MKKSTLLLFLFLFSSSIYAQHKSISQQTADSLLHEAYVNDQQVRKQTLDLIARGNQSQFTATMTDSLVLLNDKTEQIDNENIQLVDSILDKGWLKGLQAQSYKAIFLIIDHAELIHQKKYVKLLEVGVQEKCIKPNELATLKDRINVREEKPQLYGTQSTWGTSKTGERVIYIYPVENPGKLNELRKQVGLDSIEQYIKSLKSTTGMKVIYDPLLTIDELTKNNGITITTE